MKNNTVPGLVSVIMSNYNTPETFLREAIESILNQTYGNFEFIIVDDCSTDGSLSVIEKYNDNRIKIIRNEENLGITKSLNRALSYAEGEFIARMDADDVSLPQRFEKQVDYLKAHPQVIVCGTWARFIGNWKEKHTNEFSKNVLPKSDEYRIYLLFGNSPGIVHPSAMFRASLLRDNEITYNEKYRYAQDFRMWVECSRYGECYNLPEILLNYRVHGACVSADRQTAQNECAYGIMREQLEKLDLYPDDEQIELHRLMLTKKLPYDIKYKEWMKTIIEHNRKNNVYNQKKLEDILNKKWAETTYRGIAGDKNPINAVKMIKNLNPKYYGSMVKAYFEKRKGK